MITAIRTAVVAVILAMAAPGAMAQQSEPGTIAFHYSVTPKAGHEQAFREAMTAHMQWRRDNGETWDWYCYEVVSGPLGSEIVFRSAGHRWADMDAYQGSDFSKKAGEHFNATVLPHLESTRMLVMRDDPEISAWPADGVDRPYIQVIALRLKPGKVQQFREAAKEIHAALQASGFPEGYAYTWGVAGGPGNSVALVLPRASWADFEEPDPNVYEVVATALGGEKAGALFSAWAETIESSESFIVRRNDEMSLAS